MANLFFRALSQGLQAFLPIAAALVWCQEEEIPRDLFIDPAKGVVDLIVAQALPHNGEISVL